MKLKSFSVLIIASFLLLFSTGCINVNSHFKEIRNNVLSNFDNTFKRDIEFALGPTSMHLASGFIEVNTDVEEKNVGTMLRKVNRIQIGIYRRNENSSFRNYNANSLKKLLKKDNWQRLVISKESDRISEVFIKEDSDSKFKEMLVVNVESTEMIIAELNGELEDIIALAIANNGLEFAAKK